MIGTEGSLEVSHILDEMKLEVKRDITKNERKEILIEIFNKFCINKKRYKLEYYDVRGGYTPSSRKLYGKNIHVTDNTAPIETYKFIVNDEEKEKAYSIMQELILNYDIEDFNVLNKYEKIIYHIKLAYSELKKHEKQNTGCIRLQSLEGMSEYEIGIYFNMLERFCEKSFKSRGSFDHIENAFCFPPKLFSK